MSTVDEILSGDPALLLPLSSWQAPLVIRMHGYTVVTYPDNMGLLAIGPANANAEPDTSERAMRREALLSPWLDDLNFVTVDAALLMASLLEATMLVGRSTSVVVALAGHYASHETTARVVTGLYRHGDRLDVAITARPIPSKNGPDVTGFVWATDGWLILQAGATEPQRTGRFGQVQIPVLEVIR